MQSGGGPAGAGGVPWTTQETRPRLDRDLGGEAPGGGPSPPSEEDPRRLPKGRGADGRLWPPRALGAGVPDEDRGAALRVEYRRVFAHNALPDTSPQTCPFYAQLDRILVGDGLEKPYIGFRQAYASRYKRNPPPLPINTDEVGAQFCKLRVPEHT